MKNHTTHAVPLHGESKHSPSKKGKQLAHILPSSGTGEIQSDVMGSYTGTPNDGDRPVQDADDL